MGNPRSVVTGRVVLMSLAVLAGAASVGSWGQGRIPPPRLFYVDAIEGNDNNEGTTPATAFATIQKAIETARDGDTVLVHPGLYRGEVNFQGKALTVQGVASGTAGIPVLTNPGDFAVSFYRGEDRESILKNFVIKSSFMAVFVAGSSPTVSNLTIVENTYGAQACADSDPNVSNCIFWMNSGVDLFGCRARYSRTDETVPGQGNITAEPLFVNPGAGDYRLFSKRGRYWGEHDIWVLDRVTSPCIDGGDPNIDPADEPVPNGDRVNMGAYGGTVQASMSRKPTPGRASNPSPSDGAVEVETDATLNWDPGSNAVSHDVYFGTESPPPLVTSQAMTQFDPGNLNPDTVYYWRIDEADSEGRRTAGPIWTFTTIRSPGPKGRACFAPETRVWVNGVLVPISKVCPCHSIVSVDSAGAKKALQDKPYPGQVEEVQEHEGIFECYDVLLQSGNHLRVAECHYFLTESGKWAAVQNLKAGTKLRTATGSIAIVSVTRGALPYAGKVYNLKIEGSDQYLVGKDAVVVRDY